MINSTVNSVTPAQSPTATPADVLNNASGAKPAPSADCLVKSAAGAALGMSAGAALGGTLGALALPTAGLGFMRAGEAIALFGPALGFVTVLTHGEHDTMPLWARLPAACFIGATMVPVGGLLWVGGLAYLASSPILAPARRAAREFQHNIPSLTLRATSAA